MLHYHDPDKIRMIEDMGAMYYSPSVDPNDFHRWLQNNFFFDVVIGAGETRMLDLSIPRGTYAFFAPAVHALAYINAGDGGESEISFELFDGQMLPDQVEVKAGPIRLNLHNNLDSRVHLAAGFLGSDTEGHPEPLLRIGRFLTGKRLLTSQTFRNLFKAETIEVGTGIQIKSLCVLFSDLKASTSMYERVGDLNALDIVRNHFDVLEAVVARHRGSVVKTIGDAVMAVFAEPERAIAAATQMIEEVRRAAAHGEDLVLKIGLHSGPCVAIQSNNQIDYFGGTVNIAARIQERAEGGEIVCSEEVWAAPGVQEVLRSRSLAARKEPATFAGIGRRMAVRRIRVTASPPAFGRAAARKPRNTPKAQRKAGPPKRTPRKAAR